MWRDVRIALRGFRRSPTFAVTAILILGIGIGVSAAMWAVCSAVLVRPIPVADPDRLIVPRPLDAVGVDISMTPQEARELLRSARTMRDVAAFAHWGAVDAPFKDGDRPMSLRQSQITGNFFDLLGVRPYLGRMIRPEEDSASHVMVLSYGAWQKYFGGDPKIVGRHLTEPYLGVPMTIVGVAPPGLDYPLGVECWVPLWFSAYSSDIVARLAPGASLAAAKAEFFAAEREIDRRRSTPFNFAGADVKTLREAIVGDIRPTVVAVAAAVGLLLLIACINVGNLCLLRATARGRELAVRRALGATASDIVRQLIVESVILAVASSGLGVVVAALAQRLLIAHAPRQLPNLDVVQAAGVPLGAAAALALLSVLLFGLAPALAVAHRKPASPLRLDARSGHGSRQRRQLRQLLVGFQVALALVMLTGAGLLTRSLARLETLKLGYRTDHLIVVDLIFDENRLAGVPDIYALYDEIAPRVRALPGVTSLTPVELPPFYGANVFTASWDIEGQSDAQIEAHPLVPMESGGPEYFRTLGIPIVRGRGILDSDREHSLKVAVVSQSAARLFWPGQNPIGKRLRFRHDSVWRTVVGIAGDIHYRTLRQATPSVFLPFRQFFWQGHLVLRSALTPSQMLPAIRRAVAEANPACTVWRVRSMDDLLAGPLAEPRLTTLVLSMFGFVALVLAAVGLYGIMASAVREQTRDIGVRMALGATPSRVRTDVLRRAMVVSLVGAAVGLGVALAGSRILASLLFEVSPTDPIALFGACAALLGVALIAAYLPASRASRVDPARALQADT